MDDTTPTEGQILDLGKVEMKLDLVALLRTGQTVEEDTDASG